MDRRPPAVTITPACPVFGACGGCALQDLAYPDQLALKRDRLERAFSALDTALPLELVPMEAPWRYRNKAEFTFSESDGRLVLGYHASRSFWRIVDLDDCLLLPEVVTRLLADARELASGSGQPAYHPRTHQGFFRYLLVRVSHATGQLMVCLMTAPGPRAAVEAIVRELMARHPSLTSVYWGITSKLADVAVPEELIRLGGQPWLEDRVGPFRLQLSPRSFLQPSAVQADRLYTRLCESLGDAGEGTAWDLYCGVGIVGLYLAQHAQQVYGIDSEPHHIEQARRHAVLNEVTNLTHRLGAVETLLLDRRAWLQEAKPDVVVVDPPRAGLHPSALTSLLATRAPRIAYVSCNAQSLARDLRVLTSSFPRYRLTELTAFDMFPQTDHVETLALLER